LGKINYLRRFISNLAKKTCVFSLLLRLKKEKEFKWGKEHDAVFEQMKQTLINPLVMVPVNRGKPLKLNVSTLI